jgi:hypothetical protein
MIEALDEHTLRVATAHHLALKNRNCIYCGDPLTNPQHRHLEAGALLVVAFEEAWPCKR